MLFLTSATWEEKHLIAEIQKYKTELENISMRKEYTNYVKIERKMVAVQSKLNEYRSKRQTKILIIQYGVPYGLQFIMSFGLFVVSIIYRYTPVILLNTKQFDLVPFGPLIRFPTGVDGAVSVPFWIFVSSYVSRHISTYIK